MLQMPAVRHHLLAIMLLAHECYQPSWPQSERGTLLGSHCHAVGVHMWARGLLDDGPAQPLALHRAESMMHSLDPSAPPGTPASRSSRRPSSRPPGCGRGGDLHWTNGAARCPWSTLPCKPPVRQ